MIVLYPSPGSGESKEVLFPPSRSPAFLTVPGDGFAQPFTLSTGKWIVCVQAEGILLVSFRFRIGWNVIRIAYSSISVDSYGEWNDSDLMFWFNVRFRLWVKLVLCHRHNMLHWLEFRRWFLLTISLTHSSSCLKKKKMNYLFIFLKNKTKL